MLTAGREHIGRLAFERRWSSYRSHEALGSPAGRRFALCVKDPAELVAIVMYLRETDGSALLLHGGMPLETALSHARRAGCCGLVYEEAETYLSVEGIMGYAESNHGGCGGKPSLFQYSSGTTGEPKLIGRSWEEISAELAAYNEALQADPSWKPVVLASVSHSYGLLCGVLASLARGSEPTVVPNTNPKLALGIIRDTPAHLVYAVPLQLHLLASLAAGGQRFHRLMTSGAPLPAPLWEQLVQRSDAVLQQYGCSEAGCLTISRGMLAPGDIGQPLPHVQLTAGPQSDSPGELIADIGSRIIRTGDVGYRNEQGHIMLMGRADDVINIGGLMVYPTEVEDTLLRMKGVREAVVYRGRHPVMGEMVKAQVAADPGVTPEMIRAWCLQQLAPYQVPGAVACVSSIEKNGNGKVSRKLLEAKEAAL
ncbi:acyl-CoA synthetase [Paenibacillus sambharensis]|uniref:Acyl-CoA synthetase n=1 Tax=Paenibacillus sambharensis TaxID=1803190 RepID=A0A2W1LK79_9BACL|nr:AMP-binding protein [Paenibacillus sambharensis]PZD95402.1 acyl-CoA synthetase [Paenibacillus sambharensis]